jgi:hypothetical protein
LNAGFVQVDRFNADKIAVMAAVFGYWLKEGTIRGTNSD